MSSNQGFRTIFTVKSYREYLRLYVAYRKTSGPYSLSRLATDLGFTSANYVSLILSGKRNLTLPDAYRVCRLLDLSDSESYFFVLLVQHDDSHVPAEKLFYKRWLSKSRPLTTKNTLKPADWPDLLNQWYLPALLSCMHAEVSCTAKKVCELTGLKRRTVEEGLAQLVVAELISRSGDKYVLVTDALTDARFGRYYLFKEFQRLQLQRSMRALEQKKKNQMQTAHDLLLTLIF